MILASDTEFYVGPSGDNGNDGLSPETAWLDPQYGIDFIGREVDPAFHQVVLNVAPNGSYYTGLRMCDVIRIKPGGWPVKPLVLRGNVSDINSAPLISASGKAAILSIMCATPWFIEGFNLQSTDFDVQADACSRLYLGKNWHGVLSGAYATPIKIIATYNAFIELIDESFVGLGGRSGLWVDSGSTILRRASLTEVGGPLSWTDGFAYNGGNYSSIF